MQVKIRWTRVRKNIYLVRMARTSHHTEIIIIQIAFLKSLMPWESKNVFQIHLQHFLTFITTFEFFPTIYFPSHFSLQIFAQIFETYKLSFVVTFINFATCINFSNTYQPFSTISIRISTSYIFAICNFHFTIFKKFFQHIKFLFLQTKFALRRDPGSWWWHRSGRTQDGTGSLQSVLLRNVHEFRGTRPDANRSAGGG